MQYPTIAQPQYGFAPTMPMMPSMSNVPPEMMAKGGEVAAENVRAQGRGKDTMLVHMTPKEVAGLQALAMQHGGSLTINPKTGLPEAGFLDAILPIAAGFALGPAGFALMSAPMAALTVGGVTALTSGDLGKGLMAGLGAFGGANLGTALSTTGTQAVQSQAMMDEVSRQVAQDAAKVSAQSTLAGTSLPVVGTQAGTDAILAAAQNAPTGFSSVGSGIKDLGTSGGFGRFTNAFSNASGGTMGTTLGLTGMATPVLNAMQPTYDFPSAAPTGSSSYAGPYTPTERDVRYPTAEERDTSREFRYFTPSNPIPFAEGGKVEPGKTPTPEARVLQNIIDVQRLAGVPTINPSNISQPMVTAPQVTAPQPVVLPPANVAQPAPVVSREQDFGFTPLLTKADIEAAEAAEAAKTKTRGSGSLFNSVVGYDSSGNPIYAYDPNAPLTPFSALSRGWETVNSFPSMGDRLQRSIGFNEGGSVPQLENGGFVLTKKAVDGLGRGSNKKGQQVASRGLGAIPIKGPGTGTSDSIKTTIDGKRPALISNGEAYVPKKQVAKKGGAKAFYALMRKAEKAADKRKRS